MAHGEQRSTGRWQLIGGWPRGHSGARELTDGGTIERGEHGDPGSGLTEARAAVERLHDGGDERRGLELDTTVMKGAREFKREGKRGGEDRGCSSPFIGSGGRQRWPRLAGRWR
jgi:hypothetical protein